MNGKTGLMLWGRVPLFQMADAPGGAGAGAAPAPAATPPAGAGAGDPPGAAKWYEGFAGDEREWLKAKGLEADDPLAVLPKLVKGHRAAEQRIGKGLDTIMDRPAKDQPFAEWARANAEVLGLPVDAEGYKIEPPADWPKEIPWDAGLEERARAIAFDAGVPPAAHQAYVGLFADHVKALEQASIEGFNKAKEDMMAELTREHGDQVPAVIARAQSAAQLLAEKAGLGADGIAAVSQLVSDKAGNAAMIKLMAAVGALMGEDQLAGAGRGAGAMTPAEASAKLAEMSAPDGAWYKATASGNRQEIARLQPEFERLARIAAGGKG